MATRKIVNKHINESSSTYVGVDGELFYDTVTNTLKISDGATPGGVTLNTDGSLGNVSITGNTITSTLSNDDLELDAAGSGSVVVKANQLRFAAGSSFKLPTFNGQAAATSAIGSPEKGHMYFDISDNQVYVWIGGSWYSLN